MRIRELLEARRNPHLNPKVDALSAFSLYANNPNMFVTFTDHPKVGVNPKSKWDTTPTGVYTYPLWYILDKSYKTGSVHGSAPFASDKKFVQLLEWRSSGRVLDLQHYTPTRQDMSSLNSLIWSENANADTLTIKDGISLWKWIEEHFWLKSRNKSIGMFKILTETLNFHRVYDTKGVIYKTEPVQSIFLYYHNVFVAELFENKPMTDVMRKDWRSLDSVGWLRESIDAHLNRGSFGKWDFIEFYEDIVMSVNMNGWGESLKKASGLTDLLQTYNKAFGENATTLQQLYEKVRNK